MAAKTAGSFQAYEPAGVGDLTVVGTTQLWPLGMRCKARDLGTTDYGYGEFIYLAGVTSCVRGSVVTISSAYVAVLAAARAMSGVAVALGICDAATKFGWFQVLGKGVAACDTVADAAPVYIDGTSGRIDDAAVAGDPVLGMRTASADDTGTCLVVMTTYPVVGDVDNA